MSTISIPLVRSWDPAALTEAAAELQTSITSFDGQVRQIRSHMDAALATWTGPAADAAATRADAEYKTATDVSAALDQARAAMTAGFNRIDPARSHLLALVADTAAAGLIVQDDGQVISPTLPMVFTETAMRERNEQQARQNDAAELMNYRITSALQAASDADQTTATELARIDVPASLATETKAVVQRLLAGGGLMTAIGGAAGPAALTVALTKAWGLTNRTVAYSSFLGKTAGQLKAWSGATRFLTGAGGADALAFARFAKLGKEAEVAMNNFRLGKPLSAMFSWIPGAATLKAGAGKAFLPMTVVTGMADVITGGGYDGARGWATRAFGAGGAAGAGTLLLAGSALGPVGLAVAGGAVLAYGVWSAGNYVYDHWGQISDFSGKAYDWTKGKASDAKDWAGDKLSDAGSAIKNTGKSTLHALSFGVL